MIDRKRYILYKSLTCTNSVKSLTLPKGEYLLELWGGQGGCPHPTIPGGYGGYVAGVYKIERETTIYCVVGGAGKAGSSPLGGYNGGGNAVCYGSQYSAGGGGATHIALIYGLLRNLSGNRNLVLAVAGGGGGGFYHGWNINWWYAKLASGGGMQGRWSENGPKSSKPGGPGTQTAGGAGWPAGGFGYSASSYSNKNWGSPGGAGWYGGGHPEASGGTDAGGGGGSGFINLNYLEDAEMWGYKVQTSQVKATLTYSTETHSSKPIKNTPKEGDGHINIWRLSSFVLLKTNDTILLD